MVIRYTVFGSATTMKDIGEKRIMMGRLETLGSFVGIPVADSVSFLVL